LAHSKAKINLSDEDLRRKIIDSGLDPDVIEQHQRNIKMHISQKSERFFSIVDTCRLDNSGIWPLPPDARLKNGGTEGDIIAFVPAAGASTRYLAPLFGLVASLSNRSRPDFIDGARDLVTSGLSDCPLPSSLKGLMHDADKISDDEFATRAAHVLLDIDVPKALYPAVDSGETFLEIKRLEHRAIQGLAAEVFVCPPGRSDKFQQISKRIQSSMPIRFYEQGPALSTVRFDEEGEFVMTKDDNLSLVPGGHGMLLRLFRDVAHDFPRASAIFIRNIDNVGGTSRDVCDVTDRFLKAFKHSLSEIQQIRLALKRGDLGVANRHARNIGTIWGFDSLSPDSALDFVLETMFYSKAVNNDLAALFARPFVLMGQVPNTGKDVGGSCVITDVDGVRQKLCLELPHASPGDQSTFLNDAKLATHFNPVFVATEIPSEESYAIMKNNPFWLVTKKNWERRNVFYQESILYELLGSSQFVNVLYVEMPRTIFNPHKALVDARSKSIKDWVL
jgi:hypothetical protein